jgi:cytochrome c biogenesis protein CcmG, thiol:disulfide interchange protein DsbE
MSMSTPLNPWLVACAIGLLSLASAPALATESGQIAPAFSLPGAKGTVQLSAYKGKTVYLDFWASWCGPCKQSFPWMNDMQKRYGAKGFQVVGVNLDQKNEDAKAFLQANPALFDVAFDPEGKTPKAYGVKGMPTSMLISPDGKVLIVHQGFKDENREELEAQIKQAIAR